jgi:hypothetical protein
MMFRVLSRILALFAVAMCLTLFASKTASAESGFFNSYCASCHSNDTATCDGCHAHGVWQNSAKTVRNLTATTDLNRYQPGQTVTVTFSGGYRTGWIRAILYNNVGAEIDRVTGPTGTGDDGTGSLTQQFPVVLQAPAPSAPGFYRWTVAWFGNAFDANFFNNSQHIEERVQTNQFEVYTVSTCQDRDGDGYQDSACNPNPANAGGDCDDTNPAVNPGAVEVCNDGIDNDCNGLTDSGDTDCTMFILAPGNGSHLTSPPTFMWSAGGNNRFKAEFSYDPLFGSIVWATPALSTTSYAMSASTWSKAPSNKQIFWRVRGANINVTPIVVQTGPEVATFWKN